MSHCTTTATTTTTHASPHDLVIFQHGYVHTSLFCAESKPMPLIRSIDGMLVQCGDVHTSLFAYSTSSQCIPNR